MERFIMTECPRCALNNLTEKIKKAEIGVDRDRMIYYYGIKTVKCPNCGFKYFARFLISKVPMDWSVS